MNPIQTLAVAPGSLLGRLAAERAAFADAYALDLPQTVTLAQWIEAFYGSRLFRIERALIGLAGRPAGDADARALAAGAQAHFSAWRVEARGDQEILLADVSGATRSWLCVEALPTGTRLHFGSAVIPRRRGADGRPRFGGVFHALLGFHRWYSKALLRSAAARLAP